MLSTRRKVAIGLPVFNGEKLIASTLECLLRQTYGDFELIISDNASTDRTEQICREYAERDSRIRYLRQPENLGAVPNFNRVFEISDSQYFKWAAVDDQVRFSRDFCMQSLGLPSPAMAVLRLGT